MAERLADLHLANDVKGGVRARATGCCPVADGIRAVLVEHLHRASQRCPWTCSFSCDRGPGSSRRSPRVAQGSSSFSKVRANDGGEQPRPDDLVGLGSHVHGEYAVEEILIALPAASNLWSQRTGGPGVHDVGIAHETIGLVALVLGVAIGRHVAAGINGQFEPR